VTPVNHIDASRDTLFFDFRPYTNQGFLFTPSAYSGEYEAIGLVRFVMWPEAFRERVRSTRIYAWRTESIRSEEAIEHAYRQALEIGADALIHFDIRAVNRTEHGASLNGIEVSGFAIKRR